MTLFDPDRHEPLTDAAWDESAARAAIAAIVSDTRAAYGGPDALWPIHPLDVSPERPDPMKTLYYGAAGVIWALRRLEALGYAEAGPDYLEAVYGLAARIAADAAALAGERQAGYMAGEAGALMLHWSMAPSPALADAIEEALASTIGHRSLGPLAGGPGAMDGALTMWEATGDARWRSLALRHAGAIWDAWGWDETAGCHLWVHELYGAAERRLGALHGFAGVASILLRARPILGPERAAQVEARVAQALAATAEREGAFANWRMSWDLTTGPYGQARVLQHCMGAPGMINGCAALPLDPRTGTLLLAGGELTWAAGPLGKIPGLCHGTPGNGYAFLKLFRRTGDAVWLERARRFAMHCLPQAERFVAQYGRRKFSVWTGDLGLALFLAACIDEDAAFPMLDVF